MLVLPADGYDARRWVRGRLRWHGRHADAVAALGATGHSRHRRDAADAPPAMRMLTRRGFIAVVAAAPGLGAASLPKLTVTKDPTCDCCSGWTEHVRAAGFTVDVLETNDLNRVKVRLGVPTNLYACHTAEVEGFVVEGHVPASTIRRLLAERPQWKGLAVRGMPVGSPGMEVEGAEPEIYEVIAFGAAGQSPYARFRGSKPA